MKAANYYLDFYYPASDLFKYIAILKDFTILLQNGDIIKYTPCDEIAFKKWLNTNGIPNIREEDGWVVE